MIARTHIMWPPLWQVDKDKLFKRWLKIFKHQFSHQLVSAVSWWRHQMETFSALLTFCEGNSPVTCEVPAQGPGTRSFGIFFDLFLNRGLNKQNKWDVGNFRRHRAHYDVIAM